MSQKLQAVSALVLIFGIALLLVLPAFDLLPSTLRAPRVSRTIFAAVTAVAVTLRFRPTEAWRYPLLYAKAAPVSALDVLDLTSVHLC